MRPLNLEIGKLYFITEVPEDILCSIIGIPFRVTSISHPFITVELATNQGKNLMLDTRLATINRSNREYFDKVATMAAVTITPQNSRQGNETAIDAAFQGGYNRHDIGGWNDR